MQQWRSSVDKTFWQKTWRLALPVSLQSMLFCSTWFSRRYHGLTTG